MFVHYNKNRIKKYSQNKTISFFFPFNNGFTQEARGHFILNPSLLQLTKEEYLLTNSIFMTANPSG